MFDMKMPWWEFPLRATTVYLLLLVMVRLSGKRTIAQYTPFDLLVVMLLSEMVSGSLNGADGSLTGGLLGAATLIALNVAAGFATTRASSAEKLIDGAPVLLARDGQIFDAVLRRERVSRGEIERALREADVAIGDVRCIYLETDGELSILKKNR